MKSRTAEISVQSPFWRLDLHLCYFDENKRTPDKSGFFIGGLMIPDRQARKFEQVLAEITFGFFGTRDLTRSNELHGKDLFHGKGNARGRTLDERLRVFRQVSAFVADNALPVRLVYIDVDRHNQKYRQPTAAYRLGLMLVLERFAEHLEEIDDLGLVFGDYEADEMTRAVQDFSDYKSKGKTPMYFGRALNQILDTVYFTHSHHSRLLQVADLLVYLAGRYEISTKSADRWHEQEAKSCWEKIKASGNVYIQRWP